MFTFLYYYVHLFLIVYNMCHRQPQMRQQLRVEDPMDPRNLDCKVTHAHSCEALSQPYGSHWNEIVWLDYHPHSQCHLLILLK